MPICIECGIELPKLLICYGEGISRSIALCKCQRCNMFADKYLECNNVIIFIDALLLRPQAYRHLLFNKFIHAAEHPHKNTSKIGKLTKLSFILVTVDVFVKWFKKDQMIDSQNLLRKFVYYFLVCLIEFFLNITIPFALSKLHSAKPRFSPERQALLNHNITNSECKIEKSDYDYRLANIVGSVVISSFPKLFFVLMVIWDYQELKYSWIVRLFVFTSNAVALDVCLRKGILYSAFLLIVSFLVNCLFYEIIERMHF